MANFLKIKYFVILLNVFHIHLQYFNKVYGFDLFIFQEFFNFSLGYFRKDLLFLFVE
jgi:hypothetical protein